MKIDQLDKDINELNLYLKKFEQKYNYSSSEFLKKFNSGKLDDNLDFTDWIATYKILQNRIKDNSIFIKTNNNSFFFSDISSL
jgi:hypothetical protein